MSKVRVTVEGYAPFDAEHGVSLLDACDDAGLPIGSDCGGFAACNACRVVVLEGGAHLSAKVDEEYPFLDRDDHRLGCQACVEGDVVVRLDGDL